ncbi:unnamed protein product [Nezara viridula]|uniref:RRM domain-containing protein n=1 Tax=Nezara viridula TaxID=85310 RepID=A0A9P0GX59_NEZVI|nr:unnamed protein product [Nezara viridula]
MSLAYDCGDFKVVTMKYSESSSAEHYILMKEHFVRSKCQEKPPDKTLFIVGVPPFVTEELFSGMFSQFGTVKAVFFHSEPNPGLPLMNVSKFFVDYPEVKEYKVAYVVFENARSVEKVLSIDADEKLILLGEEETSPFGLHRWCKEYNRKLINPADIKDEIDNYMEEYDKKVEEEEMRLKEITAEPDEEGWITVTKKGRNPGFARKESVHKNIMKKEKLKVKKKQLLNFYRFQIKESKMNQLVQLREKFEEDKKKIEQMKKSRTFKPF